MPLTDAEVLHHELAEEEIVPGTRALLRREQLRLPGRRGVPVLGLERTTLPDGPTREAVLLVHGFGQNHMSWKLSRRSFAGALAQRGFDVLNLDLRGHGRSRRHGAPPARAVDEYVDDVARVASALRAAPFLVGHSLGGAVGVRAALRVELRGLVHLCGVYDFGRRSRALRSAAAMTQRIDRVLPDRGAVHLRPFGRVFGRYPGAMEAVWRRVPLAGWSPRSIERELLRERLVHGFDRTGLAIWKEMSTWIHEPVAPVAAIGELGTPILVMTSEGDALATPDDARGFFDAAGARDKTLIVLNEAEHGLAPGHLDIVLGRRSPDVVWPLLFSWLEQRASR
jgi:pimeloyl-ACP methyl ester carboxylesterase